MQSAHQPLFERPGSPPAPPWTALAGLFTLFLLLLPALLRGGLALDDRELIFENPATSGALGLAEIFARDYFHHLGDSGQWRPLASLSLGLDRWLFGTWSAGYHLMNGVLHVAVAACAAGLLGQLKCRRPVALLGLAFFSLHPVLADSVVWIAGRTSMLSALFPLAGAWLALTLGRGRRGLGAGSLAAAGLGLALGLLAKEDALVFAGFLPCLGATRSRRDARRLALASALVVAMWCAGRWLALGAALPSATSAVLAGRSLGERLVVGGAAWLEALRLTCLPLDYPPQYRESFLIARNSWFGSSLAIALSGWGLALLPPAWCLLRRPVSLVAGALGLAVLAFLPMTQIVPLGEIFAPRFLYLPLLFGIPVAGCVLNNLAPRLDWKWKLGALALVFSLLLYQRAGVYENRGSWRAEMLRHQPGDVPSWNARGLWWEAQGQDQEARQAWHKAIELDPDYSRSWSNLGRVQWQAGELEAAERSLRQALRVGPRNPIPRVNLAGLLMGQERYAQAAPLYREATQLAPGLGPAWRGWGSALERLGDLAGARRALETALRLDPGDRGAQTLLRKLAAPAPTSSAD